MADRAASRAAQLALALAGESWQASVRRYWAGGYPVETIATLFARDDREVMAAILGVDWRPL